MSRNDIAALRRAVAALIRVGIQRGISMKYPKFLIPIPLAVGCSGCVTAQEQHAEFWVPSRIQANADNNLFVVQSSDALTGIELEESELRNGFVTIVVNNFYEDNILAAPSWSTKRISNSYITIEGVSVRGLQFRNESSRLNFSPSRSVVHIWFHENSPNSTVTRAISNMSTDCSGIQDCIYTPNRRDFTGPGIIHYFKYEYFY